MRSIQGRGLTSTVRGRIDAQGRFTGTSTPSVGEAAGLSGTLTQDANGHLSGTLTWAIAPPLDYHYTFTRQTGESPFTGVFQGTWVAATDPTDAGTSAWTVQTNGIVTGRDSVTGDDLFYDLIGIIDANGRLTSIETASDDGTATVLSGTLARQADGKLRGVLRFDTDPPTDYNYELTPVQPTVAGR